MIAEEIRLRIITGVVKVKNNYSKVIFKLICVILSAVFIISVSGCGLFNKSYEVDGKSMEDTLKDGQKVTVKPFDGKLNQGDIICFKHGENNAKPMFKRVIATEGQYLTLDLDKDRILVDNVELNEPYRKGSAFSGNSGDNYLKLDDKNGITIPDHKTFVMGDNRQISLDSRYSDIGLIDYDDIIGIVSE